MSHDGDGPRGALVLVLGAYVLVACLFLGGHGWVWDDLALVVRGRLEPLGEALKLAWTADFWLLADGSDAHSSGLYRPVTGTFYALERAVFGQSPGIAHGMNVLLHGAVAACVAVLARQLGGRGWIAAAVVLVHPHAGELVGNVAARTDLLAALGVVGALILRERRPWWAGLVLLSGCLAKEVAFAGLGLWWALDLWQHRRPAWAPGLVAVGVALGLRWVVLGVALDPEGGTMDPIGALASTGHAFADLVVPLPAGPWPVERSTGQGLVLALTVLAGSTFAAWRGRRGLLWVVGWIALAWAPMAGWLPVEVRPSRALLYLPLLGLAVGVSRVPWDRTAWLRGVGSVLVLVLVAGHGLVASRWQDPLTLWEWGVEMNPEEPLCQLNLGRARAESGDLPAAKSAYEKAAGLAMQRRDATWFVPAATALGHLALEAGDADQARIYWEDAVSIGGVAAAEAAEGLAGLE